MDAVKFLKEKKRMCDFFHNQSLCSKCPIQKLECGTGELDDVEQMIVAVEAVERWSTQHPIKTRQNMIIKEFPNIEMIGDFIDLRPCDMDPEINCPDGTNGCTECKKRYWLTEVE